MFVFIQKIFLLFIVFFNNECFAASLKLTVTQNRHVFAPNIGEAGGKSKKSIEKLGLGDVIIQTGTYTGNTLLSEGRLFLTNSLDSDVQIAQEALLGGPGTFNGNVINGGTLTPSASGISAIIDNVQFDIPIGTTTTIDGDYTQTYTDVNSKGFMNLYTTPSTHDVVAITGTATFDFGFIYVTPSQGDYSINTPPYIYTTAVTWGNLNGAIPLIMVTNNNATVLSQILDSGGIAITSIPFDSRVLNKGISNISFLADESTDPYTIPKSVNFSNTTVNNNQAINKPVIFTDDAAVTGIPGSTTVFSATLTTPRGKTLSFVGGGSTTISADNSKTFESDVAVVGSNLTVTDRANLGSGTLSLTGAGTTLNLGTTTNDTVSLSNPINLTDTVNMPTVFVPQGASAILAGPLIGAGAIQFSGAGTTNLTANSTSFTGTINPVAGTLKVNADFSSATAILPSGATLGGAGTIGQMTQSGGIIQPGNSIGTLNINGDYVASGTNIYIVELSGQTNTSDNVNYNNNPYNGTPPTLFSNLIDVTGNTTISGDYTFSLILDAGTYKANSIIDYTILETGGALTTTGATFYIDQATNAGIATTIGVLSNLEQSDDGTKIVLKLTVGGNDVIIPADQTTRDLTGANPFTLGPITLDANDILATNDDPDDATSTAAPVADQVELTNIVFNTNTSVFNDPSQPATADAFRIQFNSSPRSVASTTSPTGISTAKGALENLRSALSKAGPISAESKQTRLWITPYANRSRVNKTSSVDGNQSWSGGSLFGIEQRDQKNIWSVGLLTGLTASRSHVIGKPSTYSKTNGLIFGAYNTLKYTDYKDAGNFGHELLISRTITSVNAQRDGLDTKKNPYYALSSYKTITDVGNAQLNYLFDLIKKSVTVRLNTGMTYIGTEYGAYREYGAGTNGLTQSRSSTKSLEWYNGIGIRKIWNYDKITVRTTFVYEYGYQTKSTGTVATSTTQSLSPTTFTTPPGPRQNKHYIQLNGSYLDRETGLKFIASYSGVLYKYVTNHTAMFKFEYRF